MEYYYISGSKRWCVRIEVVSENRKAIQCSCVVYKMQHQRTRNKWAIPFVFACILCLCYCFLNEDNVVPVDWIRYRILIDTLVVITYPAVRFYKQFYNVEKLYKRGDHELLWPDTWTLCTYFRSVIVYVSYSEQIFPYSDGVAFRVFVFFRTSRLERSDTSGCGSSSICRGAFYNVGGET